MKILFYLFIKTDDEDPFFFFIKTDDVSFDTT